MGTMTCMCTSWPRTTADGMTSLCNPNQAASCPKQVVWLNFARPPASLLYMCLCAAGIWQFALRENLQLPQLTRLTFHNPTHEKPSAYQPSDTACMDTQDIGRVVSCCPGLLELQPDAQLAALSQFTGTSAPSVLAMAAAALGACAASCRQCPYEQRYASMTATDSQCCRSAGAARAVVVGLVEGINHKSMVLTRTFSSWSAGRAHD